MRDNIQTFVDWLTQQGHLEAELSEGLRSHLRAMRDAQDERDRTRDSIHGGSELDPELVGTALAQLEKRQTDDAILLFELLRARSNPIA